LPNQIVLLQERPKQHQHSINAAINAALTAASKYQRSIKTASKQRQNTKPASVSIKASIKAPSNIKHQNITQHWCINHPASSLINHHLVKAESTHQRIIITLQAMMRTIITL
jgi:hypothetical protein